MEFQAARDFLSLDDQRAGLPLYDQEPIDEGQEPSTGAESAENRLDLGETEREAAHITDFDLLKVIGKGSFGKVSMVEARGTVYIYSVCVFCHILYLFMACISPFYDEYV